ncbi:MAG TPA: ABC transporter permease [Chthonomonadales bacterium]|nr:ABC transporter permease [Chthonomonadales bacterium]
MNPADLLLVAPALRQYAAIGIAACGGVISERAGVVNIALEGMMLAGAFVAVWVAQGTSPAVGLAAGASAGMALGLLHVLLTQRLKVDHIVSGIAINLLALNGTAFLLRQVFRQADPPRHATVVATLPIEPFIAGALVLPVLMHVLLRHTSFGLRLRASGESPEAATMAGVRLGPVRTLAVALSGLLAGCAGAYLSLALVGGFTDSMVSGRGFIALAAVVCGRWTPLGAAGAALAFGYFDALQLRLQGAVPLPHEFLQMLPYALTIIAAMALRSRPPAALGRADVGR